MRNPRDIRRSKLSGDKSFTRRAMVIGGVQLGMFATLGARLYYLQVLQADRYRMLADDNRINLRLLPPPRGRILDRNGIALAVNQQNYRVVVVPEQVGDLEKILDSLSGIVPIPPEDRERVLRDARRRRKFVPLTIVEHLTWAQVSRIEINAPDLPGVSIDVGQVRQYPYGSQFAHVIGYVASPSEAELTGDPVLELPDFRIGKNGIEKTHDLALRGRAGNQQVEVNAHGRVIRELAGDPGRRGADVELSIDFDLQNFTLNRLGAESAGAALVAVHTGEVLALAATPSYDPNAFNRGLSRKEWQALIQNPRTPLINKAISGLYPPGSTFKMVTALASLEAGVTTGDHIVWCPGYLQLGRRRFHCWKRGGHGNLNLVDALAQSCDVYFYDLALRVGIERIAAMANRLGLGHRLGLDLPGESGGLMPTPDWKLATRGRPWLKGESLNAGIGQGYTLATPLQLAVMTARIANGGRAVVPHLTRRIGETVPDLPEGAGDPIGLSQTALDLVRAGMEKVVNNRRGTAYRSRIEKEGWEMAGKTGTSQVKRITQKERAAGIVKNEDRPWKDRDHALFVGYAPIQAPRYAVAVIIEHGGGGSKVAAPVARDILLEAQRRDPLAIPVAGLTLPPKEA